MHLSTVRVILFSLAVLVSSMILMTSAAKAADYVLGDSLSDAGALGITYTNPASVSPWIWGTVWVQDIPGYTSTPVFCNAPQCAFNSQAFYYTNLTGNNYAVGGAG